MKTFFYANIFCYFLLSGVIYSQIAGDTVWTQTYPENSISGIAQTQSKDFYLLGYRPVKVYKTDSLGNTLWVKVFSTATNDYAQAIILTPDQGFIIAASNASSAAVNSDIWVIRCDANGDTIWTRKFNPPGYDGYAASRQIRKTNDGNYVISGLADIATSNQDVIVVKFTPDGDLLWSKTYGGPLAEEGGDLIQSADGNLYITGYTKSFGGTTRSAYLIKTNSNGDTIWTKAIAKSTEQWTRGIGLLSSGDVVIGGWMGTSQTAKGIWVVRVSPAGDTVWTKVLSVNGLLYQINRLTVVENDQIIFTGANNGFSVGSCDQNGNLLWLNSLGTQVGLDLMQGSDHQIYAVGQKNASTSYLMKISSGIVPVELTSFSAKVIGSEVTLNWSTATETNNKGFEIQKSVRSSQSSVSNWEAIGFVDGKGTTTEKQNYSFTDNNVSAGKYFYRLKQIDFNGTFEYSNEIEVDITLPNEFALYQNYPNPFNPSTVIQFTVPNVETGHAPSLRTTLKVFDVLGNEISTLVNEYRTAGSYEIEFDSKNLPSGIYFYKLQVGNFTETKKMILIR